MQVSTKSIAHVLLAGMLGASAFALNAQESENNSQSSHQEQAIEFPMMKRCANLGNMFEQPKDQGWGGRLPTEQDLKEISMLGFDTVRLPVRFSAYADDKPPYSLDRKFMQKIDRTIDWAEKYKLNIIVDMHHYDELFVDPAAHSDRLVGIWRQIAARYADRSDYVLFEIINEPHKKLTNDVVEPILVEALAAIRETNPTRRVIVGGDNWSGISSLETFDPPEDPYVIATFHFYEPFAFTHQGASWVDPSPPAPRKFGLEGDAEWLNKMTAAVQGFKKRTGIPLFLGEFGAIGSADRTERVRYTYAIRQHAERLNLPWCVWAYTNTFPVKNEDGWMSDMLAALGLPPEE